MEYNGFTLQFSDGRFYKGKKDTVKDITNARIYKSLGSLLKYAIKPNYVADDMIDAGIHLIQLKEDETQISVVDLGEAWACYHMYYIGYEFGYQMGLHDKEKS